MAERPDDPIRDPGNPEHGRYPDGPRNFEAENSLADTEYDASLDREMIPTDDVEINEHGSER